MFTLPLLPLPLVPIPFRICIRICIPIHPFSYSYPYPYPISIPIPIHIPTPYPIFAAIFICYIYTRWLQRQLLDTNLTQNSQRGVARNLLTPLTLMCL